MPRRIAVATRGACAWRRTAPRSVRAARPAPIEDARGVVVRAFHRRRERSTLRLVATRRAACRWRSARARRAVRSCALARRRPPIRCPDYRLRVTFPGDHVVEIDDPYRYGRVLTDFDLHLFGEGHAPPRVRQARRASHHDRQRPPACTSRCGRRTPTASASIGDFNGWDGRVHPMRLLVPAGIWEIFIPDLPRRREIQVRDPHARRRAAEEERSVRLRVRSAAADRVGRPRHLRLRVGRRATGWRARREHAALARAADVDLRGAPRLVGARARRGQPVPDLSRAGRRGSCRT